QIGKDATFVEPSGSVALLNDRPSLLVNATVHVAGAAEFPLTLIVNHLRSLSGIDDPADGDRVRHKRRAQAEYLATYLQTLQSADPAQRIVLVGDFNAFAFNDGYVDVIGTIKGTPAPADEVTLASDDLVNPDLVDLVEAAPPDQQYSFVFDGTAQELDHVLVTQKLLGYAPRLEYARTNADFPEIYRNDANRPERISDHDPIVAFFTVPLTTTLTYTGDLSSEFGAPLNASVAVGGPPSGQITFTLDGGQPGTAPIVNGGASLTYSGVALGTHTVTATFAGDDVYAPAAVTTSVLVVDTTPPAIASVTPSATSLWPPTKTMMPITIVVAATDIADPDVTCRVMSIASTEGAAADQLITGPLSIALRAARAGNGTGRMYTITVDWSDARGGPARPATLTGLS